MGNFIVTGKDEIGDGGENNVKECVAEMGDRDKLRFSEFAG